VILLTLLNTATNVQKSFNILPTYSIEISSKIFTKLASLIAKDNNFCVYVVSKENYEYFEWQTSFILLALNKTVNNQAKINLLCLFF
jgi:hypothetical protein